MALAVGQQYQGRTVLLTGGLGGVGSACLEKLLRQTEVGPKTISLSGAETYEPRQRQ
jgi:FlaA1/EpsC-like NDP-sugar epimerase